MGTDDVDQVDHREPDRRAVEASRTVVGAVTASDPTLPTPCSAWTLGELLAHMVVQHHGFARAVAGERTAVADWQPIPLGTDVVRAYDEAADHALASFAAPGALAAPAHLREIRGGITVPGATAISFHLVDYVAHTGDVAQALGRRVEFDDTVLDAALAIAAQVPDGPPRTRPGASFAPRVAVPAEAAALGRVLAALGRSASWRDR